MAGLDYTTRDKALWGALLALCLASAAAYVLWALPAMPETVPTHWGADGSVNGWSDNYSGDGYPDGDTLCSAIIFQFSLSPDAPSPAVLVLALLTFFCGAFYAFSPEGAWRFQSRSLVKEPAEPAEGALSRYRAGGIVLMAAGAVIGVLAFIL